MVYSTLVERIDSRPWSRVLPNGLNILVLELHVQSWIDVDQGAVRRNLGSRALRPPYTRSVTSGKTRDVQRTCIIHGEIGY